MNENGSIPEFADVSPSTLFNGVRTKPSTEGITCTSKAINGLGCSTNKLKIRVESTATVNEGGESMRATVIRVF